MSEMTAFTELKLPKIKSKREKFENDRILMRQLLANIERNRTNIRKNLLEGDSSLSHARRMAVSSIKERIDEQARMLEEEEQKLKDQCDYYRRKEERLRTIKQKLEILGKDESMIEEQRDGLIREAQLDYDKFL